MSDLSRSENVVQLKALLTDSVHGESLLVEPYQSILLPALSVHLFFTITSGRYFFHCIRRNHLHSPVARTAPFFQTWSEWGMTAPSLALLPGRCCTCLSHIVSDSDVYASVSVSCSRSCPLTSAGFRSSGVLPGSTPWVVRSCHTSDLLSRACLTYCTVARGRPRLCSRSDLLQDLGGLL